MSEKMILPTDAMVAAGHEAGEIMQRAGRSFGSQCRWAIYAALNHPDTRGLFADEDARPWELLDGPPRVGDKVRVERAGLTTTAVVARVDADGEPWTAEGGFIGALRVGTWYVRRTVKPLPPEPGTVIVPAEGHEYITATVGGMTYRAREAMLIGENQWNAAWRSDEGALVYVAAEQIDAGTWKVGNR